MNDKIDCRIFGDRLDGLNQGTLPGDMVEQLLSHTKCCPDCATLLRIQEELTGVSASEMEARVPDEMVAAMWSRVERAVAEDATATKVLHKSLMERLVGRPAMQWLVPAQAVAIAVILVGAGVMWGDLRALRDRERGLLERIGTQEQRISRLDRTVTEGGAATASLLGRPDWPRNVDELEGLTVEELRVFLADMPADTQILNRTAAERLRRKMERDPRGERNAVWRDIVLRDGLQVDEALALIDAFGFSPGDPGPAKWLHSFAQTYDS